MSSLTLGVLGPFQATYGDQPLTEFRTNKVRALLIYLAIEARPLTREALMALLWPGLPERSARANLRQIAYYLRKDVPEVAARTGSGDPVPLLVANRQTIGLNPEAAVTVDAAQFEAHLAATLGHEHVDLFSCPDCRRDLESALALYRGHFLVDFYLDDSNEFEEWAQTRREAYRRQALDALEVLTAITIRQKDYAAARGYAERQLEIDDLREAAYRQLMEVLALSGQRNEALAVYENCRRLLADELGMAPTKRTTELYEQIAAGELSFESSRAEGVRGYEIKDEIGAGAYGAIHRAVQPNVGREVAVKVIRRRYANDPEFIRRFEAEAQTVARLEHPHIVPLYDYWRDPEGAYLVMRYLKGGNLLSALEAGPWDLNPAGRLLEQIAGALAAAHAQGVVHRDIKPANILLDETGNAYLADFGIAKDLTGEIHMTAEGAVIGTPDYISPEQILNDPITPQSDIYSLGAVLYETLTGEKPFPDSSVANLIYKHLNDPVPLVSASRPGLPTQVDVVIQKATAKQPADRYASALEMAAAFKQAMGGEVTIIKVAPETMKPQVDEVYNPYKGLRAFQEADADDFFGREALVDQLIGRFGESRFLAVVGPSGSGKSSAVKAGLIPALRAKALPGSEKWFVAEMVPGTHPLEELELALWPVAVDPPPSLVAPMERDTRGMLRTIRRILPDEPNAQLLLVIDQFEELFTLVEDEERRDFFVDSLLAALRAPRSPLRVVVTLRADFYDRPLQYEALGRLLKENTEIALPLTAEELSWAVREPARRMGVRLENGLAEAIVADVAEQPGALPLLQYALTELFERRQNGRMTREAYEEIGGVPGALGRRAEQIYSELDPAGQAAARQIFLRLVTLGEGVEDTRRRVLRSELESFQTSEVSETSEVSASEIDAFGTARLLTFDHDPVTRRPTVEVAHEALLREWRRLRGWLEESRYDVRLQRALALAAAEWADAGQAPGFLLRDARLDQFAGWAGTSSVALTGAESAYLRASMAARKARLAEEEARRQRELETAQKLAQTERARAEEQTQAAGRLRQRAILLTGALVVAGVLAIAAFFFAQRASVSADEALAEADQRATAEAIAIEERQVAEEQRQEARRQASIGLAALAREELSGASPERAVLLGLAALEEYPYTSQAAGALTLAIEQFRALRVVDTSGAIADMIMDAAWSPDGSRMAASSVNTPKSVVILDAATGRELLSVEEHHALCKDDTVLLTFVSRLAWSPSGDRIATVGHGSERPYPDCGTVVFDTTSGEILLTLSSYASKVLSLDWSPEGTTLVTGHEDGTLTEWDAQTGAENLTLNGHNRPVRDVAWSPDGSRIASASEDGTAILWDAESGRQRSRLSGHAGPIRSLDWSPDGSHLVTGGNDGLPRIWDVTSGETLLVLSGHHNAVVEVEWSPDGNLIASQSLDFTVKLWDATSGGFLFEIRNAGPHWSEQFGYTAFSPDSKQLLTGASRLLGHTHVWDVSSPPLKLSGHASGQEWGNWSPDGTMIATSGMDRTFRIWDATTGEQLKTLDIPHQSRWSDWSPDSTRLAVPGRQQVTMFNVSSGEALWVFTRSGDYWAEILSADWSPDGSKIAAAEFGYNTPMAVFILDAETGELLATLKLEQGCSPLWAEWSPDSSRIVTTCTWTETGLDTPARIWDATSGEIIRTLESEHGWSFRGRWSPDGAKILVAYDEGVARIWDVESGEAILTYAGHTGRVWTGAWSPDGKLIATTDVNSKLVKIWDSETGQEIVDYAVSGDAITLEWSPDGEQIIITGDGFNEPIIKRVFGSPEELITYARECCVSRQLTAEERVQFGLDEAQAAIEE